MNIRPYTDFFLKNVSKFYDIVLYTSGPKYFVDEIIRFIDPDSKFPLLNQTYISKKFYTLIIASKHTNHIILKTWKFFKIGI